MVDKALSLSGTVVMGLPIMVQLTEAERNRLHPGDGYVSWLIGLRCNSDRCLRSNLNLPPGVSAPHGGAMQYVVSNELHRNPLLRILQTLCWLTPLQPHGRRY